MNKKIYLITLLSLFIILPHTIYADCTKEELNHFKEIEDEYKVSYEFNKETKDYNITFILPSEEPFSFLYLDPKYDKSDINIDDNNRLIIKEYGYDPGEIIIEIIGTSKTCDSTLKKIKLNLAKYNQYSEDPLCEEIEEFVLCQPTYDRDITYETFVSRVNNYKKAKAESNQPIDNSENNNSKVLNYIEENLFNIIIIVAFIIITIITVIVSIKSIKKSRRLE